MERLTDWLEDRPLMSARLERRQTNAGEPVVVAQIRDPGEGNLPPPQIARQSLRGRGPPGRFAVGEVEAFDNRAALPAVVRRIGRFVVDVGA
jgi:hypothetical protein